MKGKPYDIDVSDAEWLTLEPLIPRVQSAIRLHFRNIRDGNFR